MQRVANQANLGTIIQGLRIENSPYNFSMMVRVCVCGRARARRLCRAARLWAGGHAVWRV